jgi:glucose-1-phosphate thymidylyltransferase
MNIVIPMAGMGKRMRPHTLTVPKPLFKIAGKSIVERLIENLAEAFNEKIDTIGFVIGDFGEETEKYLLNLANKYNAKGKIFYQKEALGTAHAVYKAAEILNGKVVVGFADTLFKIKEKIISTNDSYIWTYKVEDPGAYGVVKMDANGLITGFVEKPKEFVSNEAIIGIYYFADGDALNTELKSLIDNDVRVGKEFQLTTALENLKQEGTKFYSYSVNGWYDCGNKKETIRTNKNVIENEGNFIHDDAQLENSVLIPPVFINSGVKVTNSVVGPYVSIESNVEINESIISNSIIKDNSTIKESNIKDSIIGECAQVNGKNDVLNISDFSWVE